MNTQSRSRFSPLHPRAVALALVASLVTSIAGAAEFLTNRSFDTAGGAGWTATSGWVEDPFAVTGEVNLHSWGAISGKLIEQKMTVWNVGGISGTAYMRLAQYSAPSGNTISIYLDYVTLMGVRKRLPLLNPSNSAVGFYPGGTDFSTGFTLPADLYILQGFSIDKNGPGDFRALEFSLDLQWPVVTLASPADAASFASGATIPLSAVVNTSGTDITSVAFYADGTLVGTGQRSVYGEWSLGEWGTPGSSHLSVMTAGDGSAAVDYNPPQPEAMYWSEGSFTSPLSFSGLFHQYLESGSVSGPGSVEFAFGANGTLDATISSTLLAAPRTLVGLTNPDPEFTFPWTNAIPGTHTLTARAYYGSGQFVTSAPVTITVAAGGFVGWLAVNPGIPADRRGPLDSNGPLNIPNLTAYAMALNPLTAVAADLPHVAAPDPAAGTMHFLYRRAKNLTGATLTPRYSANLQGWSNATVLSETVVEDADTWERVDALIQVAPGSRGFLILAVQTVP